MDEFNACVARIPILVGWPRAISSLSLTSMTSIVVEFYPMIAGTRMLSTILGWLLRNVTIFETYVDPHGPSQKAIPRGN